MKRCTVVLLAGVLAFCLGMGCGAEEEEGISEPTVAPASPTPVSEESFITIDAPSEGDTVMVPVHVEGRARVFEGALLVAVKDAQGDVLCEMAAQATAGAPDVGTWAVDLAFAPPSSGSAEATVEAYSESPRDGSIENLVSVSVTLSSDLPAIVVTEPRCNQQVSSPIHVEGTASVFEGALVVTVKDLAGEELAREYVQASEGAPGRGTFAVDLELPSMLPSPTRGTVEAFSLSPRDGSVENLFAVPVVLESAP